jgi:hypothetical protein
VFRQALADGVELRYEARSLDLRTREDRMTVIGFVIAPEMCLLLAASVGAAAGSAGAV